jgi:hypothetical protein
MLGRSEGESANSASRRVSDPKQPAVRKVTKHNRGHRSAPLTRDIQSPPSATVRNLAYGFLDAAIQQFEPSLASSHCRCTIRSRKIRGGSCVRNAFVSTLLRTATSAGTSEQATASSADIVSQGRKRGSDRACSALPYNPGMHSVRSKGRGAARRSRPRRPTAHGRAREGITWNERRQSR